MGCHLRHFRGPLVPCLGFWHQSLGITLVFPTVFYSARGSPVLYTSHSAILPALSKGWILLPVFLICTKPQAIITMQISICAQSCRHISNLNLICWVYPVSAGKGLLLLPLNMLLMPLFPPSLVFWISLEWQMAMLIIHPSSLPVFIKCFLYPSTVVSSIDAYWTEIDIFSVLI